MADAQAFKDVMGGSLSPPPSFASAQTSDEYDGEGGTTLAMNDRAMRVVNMMEAYHKPLPLVVVIAPPDVGQQKRSTTTMTTKDGDNLNQADTTGRGVNDNQHVVGVGQLATINKQREISIEGCMFDDNNGACDCAVTMTANDCSHHRWWRLQPCKGRSHKPLQPQLPTHRRDQKGAGRSPHPRLMRWCGQNVDVCAGLTEIIHSNPVQNILSGPTSGDVIGTVVNTSSVISSGK